MNQVDPVTEFREKCTDVAVFHGLKWGAIAGTLSGSAIYGAHMYFPKFRKGVGISGKVGTMMMLLAGSFFLKSELTMVDAMRYPHLYGIEIPDELRRRRGELPRDNSIQTQQLQTRKTYNTKAEFVDANPHKIVVDNKPYIPFYNKYLNFLYDHPYRMLLGMALPAIGVIFYQEGKSKGIRLQNRLLHTRVLGQGAVLTILITLMTFREVMEKKCGKHLPVESDYVVYESDTEMEKGD